MRSFKMLLLASTLSLAWAGASLADEKPAKKESSEKGDKKGDKKDDKKDEKPGTKSISPYTEKLLKGHKLVSARDFAGAVEAYRSAIAEDEKNPWGHYYLGAAQFLKGDATEAEASWQNALRASSSDPNLQSKVKFGLADLRERQRKLDDSKTAWQDYGKFVAEHPKVQGYPNTPGERQKATDKWRDLEKKYGEVKARIAAREKEQADKRNEEAQKSAAEEDKKGGKKKLALSPRRLALLALLPWLLLQGCGASPSYQYRAGNRAGPARPTGGATKTTTHADSARTVQSMPGVAAESVDQGAYADEDDATGGEATPPPPPPAPVTTPEAPTPKPQPPGADKPADLAKNEGKAPGKGPAREGKRAPIVVYTAEFGLQVVDVRAGIDEAERMAREVGGLVSKRTDRMIVIRVPAARFYESVGRIERLGEVTRRDVSAQDVTEEYLDLEVRLRNARAVRDRLQVLLARATTVKESIEIERELSRINAEIDTAEGRLKYLRDRATFSTITLHLEQRSVASPPPSVRLPFSWLHSPDLARLLSL